LKFSQLSLVRAAGFLIPCYIMARAMNALQMRQQQQVCMVLRSYAIQLFCTIADVKFGLVKFQEAPIAATEVRYLFQAGQAQAIVSPGTRG
jgi:hypothetical protein